MNIFKLSVLKFYLPSMAIIFSSICLASNWPSYNGNIENHRYAKHETKINTNNVNKLIIKWEAETNPPTTPNMISIPTPEFPSRIRPGFGSVMATPTVVGNVVYTADFAGRLTARDKKNGHLLWEKDAFLDYSDPSKGQYIFSFKATPVVKGDLLVIGSQFALLGWTICPDFSNFVNGCMQYEGATVIAVNRHNGNLVWSTKVGDNQFNSVRGSVSIYGNKVFAPLSSGEEEAPRTASAAIVGGSPAAPYPCCSSSGGMVALDLHSGAVLWQTYTAPRKNVPAGILAAGEPGYTGAAIFHHSPTIDIKHRQVFGATTNNYTVPEVAKQCERHRRDSSFPEPVLPQGITCANLNDKVGNYTNAVVAFDMDNGAIKWAFRAREYDAWTHACGPPDLHVGLTPPGLILGSPQSLGCNNTLPGPDYGVSMPILVTDVRMPNNKKKDLLLVPEKGGVLYILDPQNGRVINQVKAGPGSLLGGFQEAGATDGKTFYAVISNMANTGRVFDPAHYPVVANPVYSQPGQPLSDIFGLASNRNTKNTVAALVFGVTGGIYPISGAGYDGNQPDGRWALINPPAQAIAEADGISTRYENGKLLTTTSFWTAIDIATGKILWQRPVRTYGREPMIADIDCGDFIGGLPSICNAIFGRPVPFNLYSGYFAGKRGPGFLEGNVTLANGVLYSGTSDGDNTMVALDAKTGKILEEFHPLFKGLPTSNFTGVSTASVVNGELFLGSGGGYQPPFLSQGLSVTNNKIYALCIDSNGDGECDTANKSIERDDDQEDD